MQPVGDAEAAVAGEAPKYLYELKELKYLRSFIARTEEG